MLLELTVAGQRFNAVMEVLRDGLTVVEVTERYRVSRRPVHGWLRRHHPNWGQRRLAHGLTRAGIHPPPG